MTHLVLTRFAIRAPYAVSAKGPHRPLTEAWIARRMALLQYPLRSLQAQTCPNFTWCIFVHPGFSQSWTRALQNLDPRIEVIEADDLHTHPRYQVDDLITTRLDSDDGLGRSAIEEIQAHGGADATAHSFDLGFKKDEATEMIYRNGVDNLFLTLFETRSPKLGVLSEGHHVFAQKYSVFHDRQPGRHLMIAHDCNVANGFISAGAEIASREEIQDQFPWLT